MIEMESWAIFLDGSAAIAARKNPCKDACRGEGSKGLTLGKDGQIY